jgi:PTS system galactitol-specific IIB component
MSIKRILIVCGSGVASSAMAANKLRQLCKSRGLETQIECKALRDMTGAGSKPNLIVVLTPGLKAGGFGIGFKDVPIVMGLSLLTGRDIEQFTDEIEHILR